MASAQKYTAFGQLFNQVQGGVAEVSLKEGTTDTLEIISHGGSIVDIQLSLSSGGGGGITGGSVEGTDLNLTTSDESIITIDLSSLSHAINYDISTTEGAIQDAINDYIGVLPPLTTETTENVTVDFFNLYASPANGKALRIFVDGSADPETAGSFSYNIILNPETTFEMKNGEAYTALYNTSLSKYIVVPGIINPKSKPEEPPAEPIVAP